MKKLLLSLLLLPILALALSEAPASKTGKWSNFFTEQVTIGGPSLTTGSLLIQPSDHANNSGSIQFKELASSGRFNWLVGSDILSNNVFAIIPSSGADGGTFSTAGLSITSAGAVTIPGSLSVTGAMKNLTEDMHGFILTAANTTYVLAGKNRVARQVKTFWAKCGSGSITAALQIGGTNITTCNALAISTGTDTTCDTGATNDLAAGGVLTLVTTSNSTCLSFEWSIETVRD